MTEPRLFVLSGRDVGRSFDVPEGGLLGRAEECAMRLVDRSVSRHHARIERVEGAWWVADLDSRNGLWVGGRRVSRARLADLAEFRLGEVEVRCRLEPGEVLADPDEPPGPEPPSGTDESGELELEEEIELGGGPDPDEPTAPEEAPDPRLRELARLAREERAGGLWTGDLAQRPGWQVLLLGLLALTLAGGVAWGGFLLVVRLRGG